MNILVRVAAFLGENWKEWKESPKLRDSFWKNMVVFGGIGFISGVLFSALTTWAPVEYGLKPEMGGLMMVTFFIFGIPGKRRFLAVPMLMAAFLIGYGLTAGYFQLIFFFAWLVMLIIHVWRLTKYEEETIRP